MFIKNITALPSTDEYSVSLYNAAEGKVVEEFVIRQNHTNYIKLNRHKTRLRDCFLFCDGLLGIPIYVVEYHNGGLSFEHTHPPHESIGGVNRFKLVSKIKAGARKKILKSRVQL